jgi:hypothetical protein
MGLASQSHTKSIYIFLKIFQKLIQKLQKNII